MSYINKEELIKRMQDDAPMNWTDTDFELGEESQYKSDCEVVESCAEIKVIPIPPRATNGDMIKVMFPNSIIERNELGSMIHVKYDNHICWINYELDWWNAPYRKE